MELMFDFGVRRIKIIEGMYKNDKVVINNKVMFDAPENKYKLSIMQKDIEFSNIVKQALRSKGMKSKRCSVVVKDSETISREFILPKSNRKNMLKLVANQMYSVNGSLENYYVDYVVIDEIGEADKRQLKVNTYAMLKSEVRGYYEFFQSIGLKPQRIDVDTNCVRKLFTMMPLVNGEKLSNVVLFVDMGMSTVLLDLIMGDKLVFTKEIPYKHYLAEYLQHRKGDLYSDDWEPNAKVAKDKLYAFISEEIYRIMQFSLTTAIRQPVSKVVLYGGNRNLPDICDSISNELGIEVQLLESISNITNAGKVADILIPSAALIKLK